MTKEGLAYYDANLTPALSDDSCRSGVHSPSTKAYPSEHSVVMAIPFPT